MTVLGFFSIVIWMDTWIRCWPVASTSEILIPGLCAPWKGSHSTATPSCHSCQLCCCSLHSCRGRGGKELSVGCGADGKQLIYLPLPNKYAQHINKISHLSHSTHTQAGGGSPTAQRLPLPLESGPGGSWGLCFRFSFLAQTPHEWHRSFHPQLS